jgi:hypothetical protein
MPRQASTGHQSKGRCWTQCSAAVMIAAPRAMINGFQSETETSRDTSCTVQPSGRQAAVRLTAIDDLTSGLPQHRSYQSAQSECRDLFTRNGLMRLEERSSTHTVGAANQVDTQPGGVQRHGDNAASYAGRLPHKPKVARPQQSNGW